ncbi:RDD family protein [Alkalicoccobacillus porphyridii]|uniref:RDD family protein n=1 Tax=Alkalicoccobacillus porphyridii TaxID=2597270 RepID=A0A554A2Z0_9BACI|nr:RDD family protein [Alkalicoccobacillus porphyridii]TSB48060.1 RDD family protein [Alkalicoccobacillus porphyridii]
MSDHAYFPLARSRRARLKSKDTESLKDDGLSSEILEEKSEEVVYAGFWVRLWAFLLDLIVVFSIQSIFINSWFLFLPDGFQSIGIFATQTFLYAGTFFVYFALMTKFYGKTVGKMVLGIKVVSSEGESLNWKQILFREGIVRLMYHVVIFGIPYLFLWLYLFVAFVPAKKGLHDLVADTYVIHDKK